MLVFFIVQLLCAVRIRCHMESKVANGDLVDISRYAYSAFLFIELRQNNFLCGSSVINQRILLTAAHCISDCINNRCISGNAFIGKTNKYKGKKIPLKGFIMHEHFDRDSVTNDIGLVAVRENIELGESVKRVAIVENPPCFKSAAVAGWGLIDEFQNIHTQWLHYGVQKIWPLEECRKIFKFAPNGTFCGDGYQYASEGDSGSALVADDYIQLGIVSFKRPDVSRSIVFYTNVSIYYKWIKLNLQKLYCRSMN